jgi:hypothetical protein
MTLTLHRDPAFDAILGDACFIALAKDAALYRTVRAFISRAIIRYKDAADAESGPNGNGFDIGTYGRLFAGDQPSEETLAAVRRAGEALTELLRSYDPGHVRGAVIEGLVETRLRVRYGGHILDNNVFLQFENGAAYTTSRSVDVVGWDGDDGECHDCKARARAFVPEWILELEDDVGPRGLAIGLVTADSFRPAQRALANNGIRLRTATLISLEKLWDLAPLR